MKRYLYGGEERFLAEWASCESALSEGDDLGGVAFGLVEFALGCSAADQTRKVQVERAAAAGLGEQMGGGAGPAVGFGSLDDPGAAAQERRFLHLVAYTR